MSEHEDPKVPNRRSARWARVNGNPFEALIAFLYVLSALSYAAALPQGSEQAAISQLLGWWVYPWTLDLALAGSLVVAGLWFGSVRAEVAGLALLSSATLVQVLALIALRGVSATSAGGVFLAVAWACFVRVRVIMQYRVLQ